MTDQLTRIYGIDLGTTYSCIAYVDEYGKPVVVPNAENEQITPSVVFFDGDNIIVGTVARENSRLHPAAVVEMVKRSMGDDSFRFLHAGQTYRPEEISSFILRKVVGDAEMATGEKIREVVITCPAWFGVNQREATAQAGKIAGLNVRAVLNEPTAAAIAYGIHAGQDQVVLVYDLGGGTFDITMIEVSGGSITVLCTGGDHHLGGKDWDAAVVRYLVSEYQRQTGTDEDILQDLETQQDLFIQAERAKKTLSQRERAPIAITHGGKRVGVELTREKLDELTAHLLDSTIQLTRKMLDEARHGGHTRFDKILLVGGSTRMPQVTRRLKEEFPVECDVYDPDLSVAKGAAVYGWKLALDDEIKTAERDVAREKGREVTDREVQREARDAVSRRFGLPAPVVEKAASTKVRNVTSKTFGVVALDERRQEKVFNLVRRNQPVPADVTQEFGTVEEDQRGVDLRLMENLELVEVTDLVQSTELRRADLQLPPGLKAGSPIVVNFRLNEQGRLEVKATEPTSQKSVEITLETASVMSDQEAEQARTRALAIKVS